MPPRHFRLVDNVRCSASRTKAKVCNYFQRCQVTHTSKIQNSRSKVHGLQTNSKICCFGRLYSHLSVGESDPYNIYRQGPTPEIWRDIQKENAFTQQEIDQRLYQQVYRELENLIEDAKTRPLPPEPGPTGRFQYQSVSKNGRNIYQRYKTSELTSPEPNADPQVVLDLEPQMQVLAMSLTVDDECIAYLTVHATTGCVDFRLRHIDSGNEAMLQVSHPELIVNVEWGPAKRNSDGINIYSLFYVTVDRQGRPHQVYGCSVDGISLQQKSDHVLLYHSDDPAAMVDVRRTKGCQYVAIQAMTKTSNEIYLSEGTFNTTDNSLILVRAREPNVQYHLDVGVNGDVFILFSMGESELAVLETTIDSLPLSQERNDIMNLTFAGSQADHVITDIDLFRDYLVLYERSTHDGRQHIHVRNRLGAWNATAIRLLDETVRCYKLAPCGNMYYNAKSLRFSMESPSVPSCVYDYDFEAKLLTLVSGQDQSMLQPAMGVHHQCVFVASRDGTKVPLSFIYRDEKQSWSARFGFGQPRPMVLIGYGSYGEPIDLGYNPTWTPLLQRGFVIAFAHTRGGGDLGKVWYHGGRLERKTKAIEDFIACAQWLQREGPFAGGALTAKATSAGGIVVGAAINHEPELVDNVVLTNAFCDLSATLNDPDLYLTPHEWDEYGNPEDSRIAHHLQSYCPVSNVIPGASYPKFLLVGTVDDDNVPYWNAVIFGKKLRASGMAEDRVLLHLEESGGHWLTGDSRLRVAALELAFIIANSSSRRLW